MSKINFILLKNINKIITEILSQRNFQNALIRQSKDSNTSDFEREQYENLIKLADVRIMKLQKELINAINTLDED